MNSESIDINERFRVGAVSFFNALPLIYALDRHPNVQVSPVVPAQLAAAVDRAELDVALVPSIDYQNPHRDWVALPIAAIGSTAAVLTVRLFSRIPIEEIELIAADTDSHTSVALCQVLWHLRFQRSVQIVDLQQDLQSAPAVLLIGDKVMGQLDRWPYQWDLGAAWTELTQLPFVYAFWTGPRSEKLQLLATILHQAYQLGRQHIDDIARAQANQHGFEVGSARDYLTNNICFDFGPRQLQGLSRFYELAHQLHLTPCNRPIEIYPFTPSDTLLPVSP